MNAQTDPNRLQPAHPVPAPAELPIRSGFMQEDRLRRLGEKLARGEVENLHGLANLDFHARNADNAAKILEVYRDTNAAQARGETITPAAQWLLDNNYLVEETIFQVKRDLPRRFYRELPVIDLPGGVRVPRTLAIAWLYVAHSDSAMSATMFRAIVEGFQSVQPLKIGELWALPSMLRFVLVENLRRLAVRVQRARQMRHIANDVADRVLAALDGDGRSDILAGYAAHARDTTFATQLLYRLRDGSQNAGRALGWLEAELEKSGSDAEEIITGEHQTLSSGNVTTGNIIRGLRLINDVDWTLWFEDISQVDTLLREVSDFKALDFNSRDQYRRTIEELAKNSELSEYDVANRAVALAKRADADVGFFLVGRRRRELEREVGFKAPFKLRLRRSFSKANWLGIALPVILLTALLVGLGAAGLHAAGVGAGAIVLLLILFAVPASEGALGFFNTLVLLFMQPTRMVGYEYKDGVPDDARTLVVMPALIGSRDDVDESVRNLEVHFLANTKGAITFALLTDWPDSSEEQSTNDTELLAYARGEIAKLNGRHPPVSGAPRFHLLHRRRLFNAAEGVWMGWERKRGKLHELNLLLRGDGDTTFIPNPVALPEGITYVMTLDADTRTMRDVVARLVGKMRHPLNRPVFDANLGRVTEGYGILQPRVTASLTTGDEASFFQRVFSSNRGLDPYVFAVSDLYQDAFGEGTFTGKGLYHVDVFERALKGKIPENAVLSHDLLEGSLARAGLVTDVELVEDYPTRYAVDASRQHRWARGDWQLLPFILDPSSGVPALSRWKMIDNLRRTLTPIFWVMASIAGWTLLPFTVAAQWQALLVLSLFLAPTFDIVHGIVPNSWQVTARGHVRALFRDVAFGTAMVALRIVLLAHLAWMMGDAIVRTLFRVFVSHQNMLEWRTASQAHRGGANSLSGYYRLMWGAVVIAAIGLAVPLLAGSTGAVVGFFFAIFWASSPAFAWLISRSAETEDQLEISASDVVTLRALARRTWAYFETFVSAEHNFLPPDNFQETPAPVVAGRTSPTNIGMYLLSVVTARDCGWISLENAARRIEQTLDTVERLDRYRGHLINWYDTRTLRPLEPQYISAVDSGNMAGHLIALAVACDEWAEAPAVYLQGDFEGVLDTVAVMEEMLHDLPDDRRQLRPLRQRLFDRLDGMRRAVDTIRSQPELASIRTINLTVAASEVRKLAAAFHAELGNAASAELDAWGMRLEGVAEAHVQDAHTDADGVRALRERFAVLKERARLLAFEMDFSFLLRQDRKLLSIGYRLEDHQLDEACYDLLASECRLTSLFGIAKGDLPTEHWFRLGRPVVEVGFGGALMSWAGSMFEYLMPPLVMKEPQGGILNQTSNLVIKRQMAYGRSRNVPWGISEAAYNARDREMTYQYTNFGVPGLGLKRGLSQNLVIAPYATVLASQFMPREAVQNLARLRSIGALGRYGFFDAVDFTPSRVPEGANHAVVQNYMAHHQGMSIVAIANAIFAGRMRDRFHSDPVIESAELLLQEKAPRDIPVTSVRTEADERPKEAADEVVSPDVRVIRAPLKDALAVNLLASGRYSTVTTATGTGGSRWNDLAVTRWHVDSTEDRMGSFLFLRDMESGDWWSATAEPKRAEDEHAHAVFSDDKSTFIKTVGSIRSEVEHIVVSEAAGEAHRITIYNEGTSDRQFEITSFAELALASEAADNAHPAFSKMFVHTEVADDRSAIFATRRKREKSEPDVALAHFVTDGAAHARDAQVETDRRAFIGRGRTIAEAAAFDPGSRLSGETGFTLDPIVSLRRRIRVPASKKVQLIFWTVVGANRDEVGDAMNRLDHPESFGRQAMLAWTRSQVQTRHIGMSLADAALVQKLACFLIFPQPDLRMPGSAIAAGMGKQSTLWPLSISGDFPIFAIRISDVADIEIVAQALRYQEYLRLHGQVIDFVVINEQASSYVQDLQHAIESLCENARMRGREIGPRQHIFTVRRDLTDDTTYRTLLAVARVVLHARNGTVFDQIERAELAALKARAAASEGTPDAIAVSGSTVVKSLAPRPREPREASGEGLSLWNGFGGFDRDGANYVIRLAGTTATPQPWINVIANDGFGFHTSAEGSSFTWSRNSRDYQLTRWSNDPVVNRPGEGIYLFDQASGRAFSPFAALLRDPAITYEARHGQGFSTFSAKRGALHMEATQVVDPKDPVKVTRLALRNDGHVPMRLRVYAFAEWVLGNSRSKSAPTIVPGRDVDTGALTATNAFSLDFGDRVAFLASDAKPKSCTADRAEFIGRSGTVFAPEAVVRGAELSGIVEAGRDPCAAISRDIDLPPGETVETLWLMGDAGSANEASDLVRRNTAKPFNERLSENERNWTDFLDAVQVDTPEESFDALVNHWLPYQGTACRIRARSAFYQASGAFGFRDQLQDTLALLLHDPNLARAQLLNAARRQFPEGDVQHWWLPKNGAGVRTMISDDVVWLGYGVNRYVEVTGDRAILDEGVHWSEGEKLEEGEHDKFFTPEVSQKTAPLYDHVCRALDLAIERTSERGLPLILGGDWNDGMNRVGEAGKGESIWLAWFLLDTLKRWILIAEERGDEAHVKAWKAHVERVKQAVEDHAWDGEWYLRGTFDDGAPLGSHTADECRIDSLAQSWSVISGEGDPEHSQTAMNSVLEHLVDEEARIIRLFTPPFSKVEHDPGYIKSYPPGVRENGGQYTHGSSWVVVALAEMGRGDDAFRCFQLLNPVTHALDKANAERFRVEPYAVSGDVYGADKSGRGGWSWYTGSAGWLYRAAVEHILGITKKGDKLFVKPVLPSEWPGFRARLHLDGVWIDLEVIRDGSGEGRLEVDGETVDAIQLGGGERKVSAVLRCS
ncbi:MAG: protein ndvB [Mesorhizobium amorphae]|nr:MAG: protein ndvB [Mesorhizobium amorphae]